MHGMYANCDGEHTEQRPGRGEGVKPKRPKTKHAMCTDGKQTGILLSAQSTNIQGEGLTTETNGANRDKAPGPHSSPILHPERLKPR